MDTFQIGPWIGHLGMARDVLNRPMEVMTMKTAQLIGTLNARQSIYKLTPPAEDWDGNSVPYVVASKAIGWTGEDKPGTFSGGLTGANTCELLIFPSTPGGRITCFGEIGGSYQCPGGDAEALGDMGYTIVVFDG